MKDSNQTIIKFDYDKNFKNDDYCLSKSNKNSTMGLAVQENYECGAKKFCKEMKSCEEALFHLQQCKRKSLDRDQDGIPCEKLCG